ncbi:hypothetical protein ACFE04_010138 [Oxalis oulophora]
MATSLFTITPNTPSLHTRSYPQIPTLSFSTHRRTVSTRAGGNSNKYLFAFLLPASLIGITVFTSLKLADKVDRQFLEEQARNQAIKEAEDADEYEWVDADVDDDDDDEVEEISSDEVEDENEKMEEVLVKEVSRPALPSSRNRPKREV